MATRNDEAREPATKASRKDAAANRVRLLAAARDLPATATARELARAADVSVATLYRHFPTRDDLLAEARALQAATCGATVDRARGEPDPAEALRSYLRETLAAQAAAPGFVADYRRTMTAERRTHFHRELFRLLERARAAGAVRPDATVGDLLLILAANAGVTATRAPDRLERSRRLADLALAGLGLSPEG